MKELTCCPFCNDKFIIKEVECQNCRTQIKGRFKAHRFHSFSEEDLYFIEMFLKNEGNIKLMEKDLKISYPTVKNRLKSITKALGYEADGGNAISNQRVQILNDLSNGKIDVTAAMNSLSELK